MAPDKARGAHDGYAKSVVVVNFPDGREFVWLAPDSPLACGQVGEVVVYRDRQWRVLGREEHTDSLTLTLGLA
jgi:hypothetical protein